jgi:hypothetical protein
VLWEFRNALWVFPLYLTGKIVLTYDRPSGTNWVRKSRVHCISKCRNPAHVFIAKLTSLFCRTDYTIGWTNDKGRVIHRQSATHPYRQWNSVNRNFLLHITARFRHLRRIATLGIPSKNGGSQSVALHHGSTVHIQVYFSDRAEIIPINPISMGNTQAHIQVYFSYRAEIIPINPISMSNMQAHIQVYFSDRAEIIPISPISMSNTQSHIQVYFSYRAEIIPLNPISMSNTQELFSLRYEVHFIRV